MQSGCLRHSELPHTTQLFLDLVYHFDRVAPFYEQNYLDQASYTEAAARLHFPAERRHALISALREQNPPGPQLDLLAQPGTVAVVTGQQVGLFTGPCYTVYKALTAARLAAHLSSQGIRAVPVFWLATEDHDFEEVNHTWVFDAEQQPRQLRVEAPAADHRPVGSLAIERYPVRELKSALAGLPFAEETAALVEETYLPGRPMGAACADLLRKVLSEFGLLFIDPMQPALRALAAPLLREAIHEAPLLTERLLDRNRRLQEAGYHAQVHIEAKTSLFFLLDGDHRHALRRDGAIYAGPNGRFSAADLAARAEQVSPNAVLRPVVQDYLLPTVAQVGGPAELAYLAQSHALYQALGRRAPVVAPRGCFTLLDARATKLAARYQLAPADFFTGLEPLYRIISEKLVPPDLRDRLRTAHQQTGHLLDSVQRELTRFDATLGAAAAKSRAKIVYQLSKIEAKTARQAARRDGRAAAEAAYLHNLLYPNRHLQERFYTMLPFLARHGLDLTRRIAENVRLECPDHILLSV